ncbi:hypothetical protein DICVIV_08040 [Dictyocaulus viviparus]|uniref:Uncharacterized protein n=1 Tax=Dictyocaulus viviparus TaxID=29172 RepID=A0A0D8XQ92_DICVI|nr:hypothetical protein DICVIV_08040 [Dictyocaulus viviparus]
MPESQRRNSEFLDPRETFEHYENRSRPTSSLSFDQSVPHGVLACEYRTGLPLGSHGALACEYRATPHETRYGIDENRPATKVTTFFPESNRKKIPLGVVLAVAIGVPVVLIVSLFGAVWLQELGIL